MVTSTMKAADPMVQRTMDILATVSDPEIPAISVIDLGIIEKVERIEDKVRVVCLPTFVGCPALDVIKQDIERALDAAGIASEVTFVFSPPWTSDRISDAGRSNLQEFGLAPPSANRVTTSVPLTLVAAADCPFCGSKDTVLENIFGPTACRATSYCRSCRNPFEQFKEV